MKPITLRQVFALLLLACAFIGAAVAQAEADGDGHRKVIVVRDGVEEKTIDLNIESGEIVVRSNDNGKKEKVTVSLGSFIGGTVLKEVAEELEKEGKAVNGSIVIDVDSDEVEEAKGEVRQVIHQGSSSGIGQAISNFLEALVAVVAIVLIFGMPVLIVGVVMYGRHKRRQLVNESIDKLLENGREIPPELLNEVAGRDEKSTLNKGVMLVAIGVGLMAFLGSVAGEVGTVGLIPALIGVAHIYIWKTEKDAQQDNNSQSA
ncbi:MAG: DUF6249 domain-containing protein [Cellvibrionaceae bacterium]|nr:DUF6249 domain-containing protein [Cellvibrionaceae bacterium]MCV6626967.1 DUF6249 domain-containing protein [Cellvibrionaceae bacterium]